MRQAGSGTQVGVDAELQRDVPVILVPGFGQANGLDLVQRCLVRAGVHRVVVATYDPKTHHVADIATHLSKLVDTVLDASGAPRVHLIGHNLGGIAIRYYVQVLGGAAKVGTAMTIGAPHQGQRRTQLELGPGASDLVAGSSLLRLLDESTERSDVRWIAFHSGTDQLISPRSSATLVHPLLDASNVALDGERHLSVRISPGAARAVTDHLFAPAPAIA